MLELSNPSLGELKCCPHQPCPLVLELIPTLPWLRSFVVGTNHVLLLTSNMGGRQTLCPILTTPAPHPAPHTIRTRTSLNMEISRPSSSWAGVVSTDLRCSLPTA